MQVKELLALMRNVPGKLFVPVATPNDVIHMPVERKAFTAYLKELDPEDDCGFELSSHGRWGLRLDMED